MKKGFEFTLIGGGLITVGGLLGFAANKLVEHGPQILKRIFALFNGAYNLVHHPVVLTCLGAVFAGVMIGALAGAVEDFIGKYVTPLICNLMSEALSYFKIIVRKIPEFLQSTFKLLLKYGGVAIAILGGA